MKTASLASMFPSVCACLFVTMSSSAFGQSTESTKTTVSVEVEAEQLYESKEVELATDSSKQITATVPGSISPKDDFENWLEEQQMSEGRNTGQNGAYFVAYGSSPLLHKGDPKNPLSGWVSARNVAYTRALLGAKSKLAKYLETELRSERTTTVLRIGGEEAERLEPKPAKQLSIMDKALTLSGKELDHQIRKHDPDWDGTGRSEAEKQKRMVEIREQFREKLSERARLFSSGALPVWNGEGPNIDGEFEIAVALVWSSRTAAIAQGVINPSIQLPLDDPEPSIRQQIKQRLKEDPDFLATSSGVRLWTNERGEQTLVAFVGVDRTRSTQLNESESSLRGRNMLAQFVAEEIETNAQKETLVTQDTLADATTEVADGSRLESLIRARAKTLSLSGVTKAKSWLGNHPASKAKMIVDVWAWTPSGREQAAALRKESDSASKSIRQMREKGASASKSAVQPSNRTNPTPATVTRRGATTKKSKW